MLRTFGQIRICVRQSAPIARRKDPGIAVFASARKLAALVYRMLRFGQQYVDVGQAEYDSDRGSQMSLPGRLASGARPTSLYHNEFQTFLFCRCR
jgi:hypothetical protein